MGGYARGGNALRGGKPGTTAGSRLTSGARWGSAAEKSNPACIRSAAPGGKGGEEAGTRAIGGGNRRSTGAAVIGGRAMG